MCSKMSQRKIAFPLSGLHVEQAMMSSFAQQCKTLQTSIESSWSHDLISQDIFQEFLRICEQGWFHLAENFPGLVCTFFPDSSLTYVNPAYCKYFNMEYEGLIGCKFLDFLPQDQATIVKRSYLSLTPQSPELTYRHKVDINGQIRWHEWTDRAFFDGRGNIVHLQAIGHDITVQKKNEKLSLLKYCFRKDLKDLSFSCDDECLD